MAKKDIRLCIEEETFLSIVKKRPSAYILLSLVALRAKQKGDISDLEIGEALIGDYQKLGVTERQYRTDKKFLEKHGFLTIKTTNHGTVVKLSNKAIFDIIGIKSDEQMTSKRRTDDEQKGDIQAPKEYGNPEINKMVSSLKLKIGIDMFADSAIERNIGKHLVNLLNKIGIEEFSMRLESILNDSFKLKNCNKIRYVYNELKSFIPQKNSALFDLSKLS